MRIPRSERTQSISAGAGAGFARAPRGSAFNALAASADDIAGVLLQEQIRDQRQAEADAEADNERTAALDATRVGADLRNAWTVRLEQMATEAPEAAPDFGRQVVETFDRETEDFISNADPTAAPFLRARIEQLRGQVSKKAYEIQSARGAAKRLADLQGTLDANANAVRSDFSLLENVVSETGDAIEASQIPADKKRAFKAQAAAALTVSGLQGLADRNPSRAKDLLDAGAFDTVLKPAQKNALIRSADTEIRRREAEARRQAKEAQAIARADLNRDLSDEYAKIANDGQGTGRISSDRLVRVLGADAAARVQEDLEDHKLHYVDRQAVAMNTPAEDAALLEAAAPGDRNVERETKQRLSLARAIEAKRKALAKDPVAYILASSPEAREIRQNPAAGAGGFDADTGAAGPAPQGYIAYMDQLQGQLGIPPENRRILSNDEAKGVVGRLQSQGAEGLADSIELNAEHYGQDWPRVYGELVEAGLPAPTRILAQMDDPQSRVDMGAALKTGRVELRKKTTDAAAIDTEVRSELADFRASLAFAPNGGALILEHEEAAQTLAYHYATVAGLEPTEAARQAVEAMVGRYEIHNLPKVAARAPADLDRDPVAYADLIVKNLQPGELAEISGGPGSQLTADEAGQAYLRSLRGDHKWVTNASDDGWLLLDGARNPVQLANGDPVEFRFDEIPEIVGRTTAGRPLVRNGDGSQSSERTVTVTDPRINGGQPTNIPTMFNGIERSAEEAADRIANAGGRDPETGEELTAHESIDAAVEAAKKRSAGLAGQSELDGYLLGFGN